MTTKTTQAKKTSRASTTKAKQPADTTTTRRARSTKKTARTEKMSQMAAAERVLAEAGVPMNCRAMVEAMATKGYWSSPGGQTPHATLYAALLRHIRDKGNEARFTKTDRGLFARAGKR